MTTTKVVRETTEATPPKPPAGPGRQILSDAVDVVLHTYEQFVANFVEFEHKAAKMTRSERARAALNLHATYLADVTAVYMRTARAAMR
jgi:hypothetical protein